MLNLLIGAFSNVLFPFIFVRVHRARNYNKVAARAVCINSLLTMRQETTRTLTDP